MDTRAGSYRWLAFLLIVVAAVPLAFFARNSWALDTETRASDLWFTSRPDRAPRPDLLIVARDDKTLKEMGRPSHADYGSVIRRLTAAGAKYIVLDIDLDDRQGHARDKALWTAISDSRRTLVMVRYDPKRTQVPDADELRGLRALEKSVHWQEFTVSPATPEWGWLNFAPATSDFIHSAYGAGVAVTETSPDPDGVMRQSRTAYLTKVLYPADTTQGKLTNFVAVVPNLAVITAISAMKGDKYVLGYRFGERLTFRGVAAQPLDTKGFTPIDYVGPAGTFPRVSMVDVLRDKADAGAFKDRIVFVGSTAANDTLSEYRMTPFGTTMPRVEITANQVQSFLDRRPVVQPQVVGLWSILGLGLLLGLLAPAFRAVPSILASLFGLLIYAVIGWALFWTSSIMVPMIPALVLTLAAIVIALLLGALMRPDVVTEYVPVVDTGMVVEADESLPATDVPAAPADGRRRWWRPGRRGRV